MPFVQCSFIDKVIWEISAPTNYAMHNSAHVWRLQLSANTHRISSLEPLLSADEVVRAKSYLQEKDRNRFILSRGTLRLILANYLNKPAASIRFSTGVNNKPFIQNTPSIHYNVAHAGDWVLIAVSDSPIGTDIEQINSSLDYSEVLPVCFSEDETAAIQNRNDFYRLWTRKESLVKATGKGIDDDLPFVPCMDSMSNVPPEKIGLDKDWIVATLVMSEKYIVSISYDPSFANCQFFEANII